MQVAEISLQNITGVTLGTASISECGFQLSTANLEKNNLRDAANILLRATHYPERRPELLQQYASADHAWVEFAFRPKQAEQKLLESAHRDLQGGLRIHINLTPTASPVPVIYRENELTTTRFCGFKIMDNDGQKLYRPLLADGSQTPVWGDPCVLQSLLNRVLNSLPDPELYADRIFK